MRSLAALCALMVTTIAPATVGAGSGSYAMSSSSTAMAANLRTSAPQAQTLSSSVDDAYTFLDQMMDLYATGSVPRLVQSFEGGVLEKKHFTDSETYDDALMIDAYIAESSSDGLSRAEDIANGLLEVQQLDPAADGRIREAYAPQPPSAGHLDITDRTSDVGNMAWVGMALVRLYDVTGDSAYLDGAEEIGTWVQDHCMDDRGAGGFTGGLTARGQKIKWKSTEHNIDLYAMYNMLYDETGKDAWSSDAQWARAFVVSMWDASAGRFFVGTLDNGVTPNDEEQPEDVNSWSYLALQDPAYETSIDWDVENLSVSVGGFSGVSFCLGDKSGVWFEGTAHLADALELRDLPGDVAQADTYLSDIEYAQTNGPNNDGLGIIAASKNRLSDCDGDHYFASLHTGATAWYILAAGEINPFTLPGTT